MIGSWLGLIESLPCSPILVPLGGSDVARDQRQDPALLEAVVLDALPVVRRPVSDPTATVVVAHE